MNTTATLLPQLVDFATVRHDSHVLTVILAGAVVSFASLFLLRSSSDGHVFDLGGFPITTAWTFFSKRHEFMVSNSKKAGGLPFRFRVLQVSILSLLIRPDSHDSRSIESSQCQAAVLEKASTPTPALTFKKATRFSWEEPLKWTTLVSNMMWLKMSVTWSSA